MFANLSAWRSLHVGERWLLVASLLSMAFCAGVSWENHHHQLPRQNLLQESPQSKLIQWNSTAPMIVHVSGAVVRPGIVRLPRGARVKDAVKEAGGVLPEANVSTLNLVTFLNDGEQVRVNSTSDKSTFTAYNSESKKININSASLSQLQSLPRIGPVMAERIVAYRKMHGGFKNFDDLNSVKGIGVKTIEKLRPFVVFNER